MNPIRTPRRSSVAMVLAVMTAGCAAAPGARPESPRDAATLASQVEIRRTEYGVPQILAENLRAGAFALAYVQLEDYGTRVIEGVNAARGRSALVYGSGRAGADAAARRRHARARETFMQLRADTREVYEGFAAGMNHYIRHHREELPDWMQPDYTAIDVFARDISGDGDASMNRFRARLLQDTLNPRVITASAYDPNAAAPSRVASINDPGSAAPSRVASVYDDDIAAADELQNVGSNAWALAPERTASGRAILLRNPHLAWSSGYYEAHLRVPGVVDFYGDFRIGGPFSVIGGFNRYLGFATTNNESHNHEYYAFRVDPSRRDHYLLDGQSRPIRREVVTVEYVEPDTVGSTRARGRQSRTFEETEFGPVIHRDNEYVYIVRAAAANDFRAGEQWLAMMRATTLNEWKDAMRIGSRTTSNFTYADRAGNIFYVWMSGAPILPHAPGGDTVAILAETSSQLWTRRASFDSLPQLHNPPGGYIHQENDSPHYTNMNAIMQHAFSFPVQEPRLRLRSQHAVEILHNDRVFSLEDVVAAKHSMRMLLADRVKDDLIAAVRATNPDSTTLAALALLEQWDNTAAADARGAVLFETWWNNYRRLMRGQDLHAVEWNEAEPMTTPRGLADPARAAEAFPAAIARTVESFGSWDVAWGDVHRVRRGDVDVPVGGCGGALGCFRVLNFGTAEDGRRFVNGGDGWVIAVEFGDEPRAYSVLAYGQSQDPASPYHANQAALFASSRMKSVHWTEGDIARNTIHRYRPGSER